MAAGFGYREQRLFVFRQLADRSLSEPTPYRYVPPNYPSGADLATGDLNKDGIADVAVASGAGIRLFYGGRAALRGPSRVGTVTGIQHLLIHDINHDRKLDFVVDATNVDERKTGVFVMMRSRSGFSSRRIHRYGLGEIEVGDVNSDGRPDIVGLAYRNEHARGKAGLVVLTCLQRPRAAFRCSYVDPRDEYGARGLELADVNGDGRSDIAVTAGGNTPSSRLIVIRQTARGGFAPPDHYAATDVPEVVEAADVSGDGRMDLVVAHNSYPYLGAFVQRRDGRLEGEAVHPNARGYYEPNGIAVGHIDGDRFPDVVLASSGSLHVLRHRTRGPGAAPLVGLARYPRPFLAEAGRPFEAEFVFSRRWHLVNARVRSTCTAAIAGTPLRPVMHRLRGETVLCRWNIPADARGKPVTATVTVRAGKACVDAGYVETVR